jgi:hypothetical protein
VSVESRVRTAAEAAAATISQVPPLALPPDRSPASRPERPRRLLARRGWLVPLAAAVAVIAVAATLVAVRDLPGARQARPTAPSGTRVTLPPSGKPVAIPRYAVLIARQGIGQPSAVAVVDTRTGREMLRFEGDPGTTFSGVAGADDDRTFVIDETGINGRPVPHAWFVLRITPGAARPVKVTALPHFAEPWSTGNLGFAISPDARTVAVLLQPGVGTTPGPLTLRTYSLVTGLPLRDWTASPLKGGVSDGDATVSWLSDNRTVAFQSNYLPEPRTIFLLDTSSPGHALLADSRPLFTAPGDDTTCANALLTPDGRTAFCSAASSSSASQESAFTTYSTAAGRRPRVLYRARLTSSSVTWAGSATQAIVVIYGHPSAADPKELVNLIGILTPNKFTPFPITITAGSTGYTGFAAF